jgi:hypothetical protein
MLHADRQTDKHGKGNKSILHIFVANTINLKKINRPLEVECVSSYKHIYWRIKIKIAEILAFFPEKVTHRYQDQV